MVHTTEQAQEFVKQIDDLCREKNIGVADASKSLGAPQSRYYTFKKRLGIPAKRPRRRSRPARHPIAQAHHPNGRSTLRELQEQNRQLQAENLRLRDIVADWNYRYVVQAEQIEQAEHAHKTKARPEAEAA